MKVICTLIFLISDNKILLAKGKKGFNLGKYNGYGGKQEPGESLLDCAIRESKEEGDIVVDPNDLDKRCIITFIWPDESPGIGVKNGDQIEVHIYKLKKWSGKPKETAVCGSPVWFDFSNIPYNEMADAEKYWFKKFLNNDMLIGRFLHDSNRKIIDYSLESVKRLD